MNPDLQKLHPYPFEKLKALLGQVEATDEYEHIALSIGEPKHESPDFVLNSVKNNLEKLSNYPTTKGLLELREAIANWLCKRFDIAYKVDPEKHVLPVNGTREAIFSFVQALINRNDSKGKLVLSPNPFYQIYEGAAILAGAELQLLPTTEENSFIPDYQSVGEETWKQTQLLLLCSPGNPTGSVTPLSTLKELIKLSDKYGFVIASDECYSEVYCEESNPPVGLLQACSELGRDNFKNCIVFHSLSKRSNLPGLRSGFVAGDDEILKGYLQYRTYHGCAMPIQHQLASIYAWEDEQHVIENRAIYKQKFEAVLEILSPVLNVKQTDASFYLWPETPISDEEFAQRLYKDKNITVLPGSYLSRTIDGFNPGKNRIRIALVASLDDCVDAAKRIRDFVQSL